MRNPLFQDDMHRISFAEGLYYIVILVLPFEQLVTIGGFAVTKWVGLLFFAVAAMRWHLFFAKVPTALWLLFVFFFVGMFMDFVHFPTLNFAVLNEFMRPGLMWILMVTTYNLACQGRLKRIMTVLFLSALIYSVFQTLNLGSNVLSEEMVEGEAGERVQVLGTDPNFAAAFFGLGIIYGIFYGAKLLPASFKWRLLCLFAIAAGLAGMMKTASRTGVLAIGVAVLAITLTARGLGKKIGTFALVGCLLGGLFYAVMHNAYFHARIQESVEEQKSSGRTDIWEEAIRLIHESPVHGYGYRIYLDYLGARTGHMQRGTHNTALAVLLAGGWLGGSFFFAFYLWTLKSAWSHASRDVGKVVFVWIVMVTVASLTLNMEITKWFWIVLTLPLALDKALPRRLQNVWV